jgi:hypothetical protein
MKKALLVLSVLLMITLLSAIEFDISGENRTRGAVANDRSENDGAWVDNRMNLGLDSQLHPDLALRLAVEIGNTTWGDGGGAISTGESIHVTEAFIKYRLHAIEADISIGQLYWMDKMGLIMDDYFSGILIQREDLAAFNTEFAWMKHTEWGPYDDRDYDIFMAHVNMADKAPAGVYALFGNNHIPVDKVNNFTLYPYLNLAVDPLTLDLAAFMDMQMDDDDTNIGFGGAAKAKADLDVMEIGLDALIATEYGLTTISPWYQNGLYIYGIGKHHDGTNLYWRTPYTGNSDTFMSLVGSIKAPLNDKIDAFAAAGILTDIGMEVNAGIEYEIIPDLFNMALYGAFGSHDNDTANYLFGSTLKVEF